jgi:hypothetical protein
VRRLRLAVTDVVEDMIAADLADEPEAQRSLQKGTPESTSSVEVKEGCVLEGNPVFVFRQPLTL